MEKPYRALCVKNLGLRLSCFVDKKIDKFNRVYDGMYCHFAANFYAYAFLKLHF